jgi:hypothetical protein
MNIDRVFTKTLHRIFESTYSVYELRMLILPYSLQKLDSSRYIKHHMLLSRENYGQSVIAPKHPGVDVVWPFQGNLLHTGRTRGPLPSTPVPSCSWGRTCIVLVDMKAGAWCGTRLATDDALHAIES